MLVKHIFKHIENSLFIPINYDKLSRHDKDDILDLWYTIKDVDPDTELTEEQIMLYERSSIRAT